MLKLIKQSHEALDDRTASHHYSKIDHMAPKYLRKFAFDTMISEEMDIQESVGDFIEGRTPKRVGARHYTKLLRQADGHYRKYATYLEKFRIATEAHTECYTKRYRTHLYL